MWYTYDPSLSIGSNYDLILMTQLNDELLFTIYRQSETWLPYPVQAGHISEMRKIAARFYKRSRKQA